MHQPDPGPPHRGSPAHQFVRRRVRAAGRPLAYREVRRPAERTPPLVLVDRAPPILAARTLDQALRAGVEETARAIAHPTLVVQGEKDPVTTPDWGLRLAALIPGAHLELVPGGTHALPAQSPDALADLVNRFLGGDRARRGD